MKIYYYLFYFFTFSVVAQSTKEIYNQSTKAYQEKDYVSFLHLTKKLDSLRPSHPTFTYNLACAYALNKKADLAFSILVTCLLNDHKLPFETEKDLEYLKSFSQYDSLLQLKSKLELPIRKSKKEIVLSEKELHPESLLYLKKWNLWLVNSIRNKKIVAFDVKSGKCVDWFINENLYAVLAMKTDKEEKFLWITTAAIPEMKGYNSSLEGKSEIVKIDIKTKNIVKRFAVQGNSVFGDLIINDHGDVFLSDSGEALIYQIKNEELSIWLDLRKEAFNLQGITFGENQNSIFVADYLKGILKIDVHHVSNRNWLRLPNGFSYKGIDGLLYYKNSLIAIQNGIKPHRVSQLFLDNNQSIIKFKIIDHNRSEMVEPTNGVLKDDCLYFIGNSPWSFYDKSFNLNLELIDYPTIYKYNLHAN